ncbi:MAG: DUF5687 family protein [Saprospiraceae bacterium]
MFEALILQFSFPAMMKMFLTLSWKNFWRSVSLGKNLLVNLMKGFMFVYLSFVFIFFGFFIVKLISGTNPDSNVLEILNQYLFYYFLVDLLVRVLFVATPKLDLPVFLCLPIPRRKLVKYYLFRSVFNLNNLAPVLFLVPFCLSFLIEEKGWTYSLVWSFTIILLSFSFHFLALFLNKFQLKKPILGMLLIGGLGLFVWLDFSNGLFFASRFGIAFDKFTSTGIGLIIGVIMLFFTIQGSFRFLIKNSYLDKGLSSEKRKIQFPEFSFLGRFGSLGQMIKLDLNLIFRNSRPRSTLIFGVLLIPFFFYNFLNQGSFWSEGFGLIFMSVFLLGVFQLNYNQYLFSWDSSYFDFILSGSFKTSDYLMSKYVVTVFFTSIAFLFMAPFCFFYPQFLQYFIMGYLLNIGVIAYIYLFIMTYNRKRIDLAKGALFNYEGSGYIQYLLAVPVLGLPFLIYAPFYFLGKEQAGVYTLMAFGIAGLILHKPIFKILLKQFKNQKYKMAAGFRKK